MVIGPLELLIESSNPEVLAWCSRLVHPRALRAGPRRRVHVHIRTTQQVLAGPPAPELTDSGLAHHGWRASRGANRYEASISVAGDPERRGPRRVASLLRVIAEAELAPVALAFHAAAVSDGERAWVFAGPRGAGKTTLALEQPAARRLGDDHALLVREQARWTVHPTPFAGREGATAEASAAPLAAVVLLSQASQAHRQDPVARLAPESAVGRLLPLVVQAGMGVRSRQQALDLVVRLSEEVPVITLGRALGQDPIAAVSAWCG